MLYFDKTNVSEKIGVNKTSALKECGIYHYWYFLIKVLSFNPKFSIDAMNC